MGSWACSSAGFAMQQLLLVWLLAGVLGLPADRVGPLQAAIGLPGVIIMLWGGANADRTDARAMLTRVFGAAAVVPLGLVLALELGQFNVWTVTAWGLGISAALSFSSPAQQAVLSRIAGRDLQRGVTAATAISMFTYMIGLWVGGQLDSIGLRQVLLAQSLCLTVAALWVRRIGSQPSNDGASKEPARRRIVEGFRASYRQRAVFDAMTVNFVSSIFNAGAFLTVFPFIVLRVYDGDAELLSWLMIVFFAGAVVSNLIMLRLSVFGLGLLGSPVHAVPAARTLVRRPAALPDRRPVPDLDPTRLVAGGYCLDRLGPQHGREEAAETEAAVDHPGPRDRPGGR